MAKPSNVTTIRPRRAPPILLCRKCLKRVDDGSKLKHALKSELKRRSKERGIKRPRVILTDCMDICPKRAVVVASATTLHRGEYLLLAGSDGIADAAALLMPQDEA
jgi:predicted metal-binding protein